MLKRTSVALTLWCVCAAAPLLAQPEVEVLSRIIWEPEVPQFGGLSALEVDGTGTEFVTVSDTGVLYRGTFQRTGAGQINDASLDSTQALLFENGKRPALKQERDTEGLAMADPQQLYIAAEFNPRLLTYSREQQTPLIEMLPARDQQIRSNMGFEALAISPQGRLITIPEGSPNIRASFQVYERDTEGKWSVIFDLPRHGGFRPVGADFAQDGHLYILSRSFNGLGFSTRIDRLRFRGGVPEHYEPLFKSRFRQFDNLEGLAVWQAAPNDLRLYAISDDNFRSAQRTEIIEFRLKE